MTLGKYYLSLFRVPFCTSFMSMITNMMAEKAILYCFSSSFVVCESFLEFNSSDTWYETNMQDSVDSTNICLKGYVPMIQQGLCLSYDGEHLFYITLHPLNILRILVHVFLLVLLHSMSYSFFFCQSSSSSLSRVFDIISEAKFSQSTLLFVFGKSEILLWIMVNLFRWSWQYDELCFSF